MDHSDPPPQGVEEENRELEINPTKEETCLRYSESNKLYEEGYLSVHVDIHFNRLPRNTPPTP